VHFSGVTSKYPDGSPATPGSEFFYASATVATVSVDVSSGAIAIQAFDEGSPAADAGAPTVGDTHVTGHKIICAGCGDGGGGVIIWGASPTPAHWTVSITPGRPRPVATIKFIRGALRLHGVQIVVQASTAGTLSVVMATTVGLVTYSHPVHAGKTTLLVPYDAPSYQDRVLSHQQVSMSLALKTQRGSSSTVTVTVSP
jgi:hypothetical protein